MPRFSLGINYWPRRSAMWMWTSFDRGELDDDFARLAALGLDSVRFFLLWEAFSPEPRRVDTVMLRRLETTLDLLYAHKLRAMPTLFTGHMSGVNFVPHWALDRDAAPGRFRTISDGVEVPYGIGDFYTGALLESQLMLAHEAGSAARAHPALYAWDLGNEFSNMREPASEADAATWSSRLTEALVAASGAPVTGGIHGEDLTRDRALRPSSIAEPWAFATMHGYPVYSGFARNRTDPDVVPFLATLTAACTGKPVLFSEFGNPTCPAGKRSPYEREPLPDEPRQPKVRDTQTFASYACLSESEMADYAYNVLHRLHAAGAIGGWWWCYADYVPELADRPPFDRAIHERSFGIVRNDGTSKPVADALAAFARESRNVNLLPPPRIDEAAFYAALPASVAIAYSEYLTAAVR